MALAAAAAVVLGVGSGLRGADLGLSPAALGRGALLGALLRRHSVRTAVIAQALLFGLWHIVSSTGLSASNEGLGDAVGRGTIGTVLGVLGAVAFTTIAGLILGWLRVHTGSLLPCITLHWVANGAGAVASALAWQLS
ncbi:lysostaphin resistance A-like protein [Gordonia sp. VNK21]|uniref:CPBP family intramembrane glutamic endopeptidase n=1 Tax=Gordonia sp. VNK21 TaxID=3382483 RepID=UPI0038D51476